MDGRELTQVSLFDSGEKIRITKPLRLIELFAGIGSQAQALKNLDADFETWKVVEIDKYAIKSYNAIHGTDYEPTDITQIKGEDLEIVDRDKYEYLMTYSFPCQDLSLAGLGKGMAEGSGTRSGLLWEVKRLLKECKDNLPQFLLMENVPQVCGKKNMPDFQKWLNFLEELGYHNKYQMLNAKDYCVPQNRNRCFMVSYLGEGDYTFPTPVELEIRLMDVLEDKVDQKYYLSDEAVQRFEFATAKNEEKGLNYKFSPTDGGGGSRGNNH